jgi:site-specific DNA-cytosine methylase
MRDQALLPKRLDLYVAGFPCQAFSLARCMNPKSRTCRRSLPTRTLLREFRAGCVAVLRHSRPRAFVLENVPGLASAAGGRVFRAIMRALGESGYVVAAGLLNSKDFGLFQHRRRLFFVGVRSDLRTRPFEFPEGEGPRATYASIRDRGPRDQLTPALKAKLEACAAQFPYPVFLPANWWCHGHVRRNEPPALIRRGFGVYSSATGLRSSVREELRMQGFPEDFTFPDGLKLNRQRELVGNSMPVDVLAALIAALQATGVFSASHLRGDASRIPRVVTERRKVRAALEKKRRATGAEG